MAKDEVALPRHETLQPKDISSEEYRVYVYDDGRTFRIDRPKDLYLLDGNRTHRVVDADGVCHRPERGWVGISWKQVNGKPFDF